MNVLTFRARRPQQGWEQSEIQSMMEASATVMASGDGSSWAAFQTEAGDPQICLIGPPPHHDCLLSISRVGGTYVIEDGAGRILGEHGSLLSLVEQIRRELRGCSGRMIARMAVAWCAMKKFTEERVEPLMAETVEIVEHVAPALAPLA